VTEAEWLGCEDLGSLLWDLRDSNARELRLFAVACCRRIPRLLTDPRSRATVEVAERHADGLATSDELVAADDQSQNVGDPGDDTGVCAANLYVAASSAFEAARMVAWLASNARSDSVENALQVALLRDIFGNPFRPVTFSAAWRTSTAGALAAQMYESRDFSAMPILADALQDAGCDNDDVLNHCRDTKQTHVRGCWVVDGVLARG
jgi:hypothetical protein